MSLLHSMSKSVGFSLGSLGTGRVGITPAVGQALAEAASVCLDERGHLSPTIIIISGDQDARATVTWQTPTDQAKRCWNDDQVATEHGAYGVASLLVEQCGLEVVERSKKKTGFDFWLGDKDNRQHLFQGKSRLEVSGIRNGPKAAVESRVKQKMKQTEVSDGKLSAVIVVVEFGAPVAKMVERCKK